MEYQDNYNNYDINETAVPKRPEGRPVFLTVLCILTWVGAGLGVLYNLQAGAFAHSEGFASAGVSGRYSALSVLGAVAGNGLCIFGAVMMWNLRKVGYFVYLFGHLLIIAVKISADRIFYDIDQIWGMMNIFTFILAFPLAFLIMYGTNLKYMNK